MKPGWYYTEWGNAVKVTSATAKSGYDVDMGERVPLSLIIPKMIRPLEKGE